MCKIYLSVFVTACVSLPAIGCLTEADTEGAPVTEATGDQELSATSNVVVPRHARSICQSASFYENYDSASGPNNLKRTIFFNDKIGHTPDVHPVHNGWAATFDFGPNDWGFMRIECIGDYDSW
jgi:hypothetical protein